MHRIRVDAAVFEGDSNVYVYGLEDDDPLTLVDTGINTSTGLAQLRTGLEALDTSLTAVEQVVVTHFHYDHAGLASDIQSESSATVYCHDLDAEMIAGSADDLGESYTSHADRLTDWGVPRDRRDEVIAFLTESAGLGGGAVDVTELSDGTTIRVGSERLTAVHLPGHTAGHTGYRTDSDELLAGDLVLPTYTPNVGGGDLRVERPLETFLQSLDRVDTGAIKCILPGHGDPIKDPADQIDTLRRHHDHRARRVYECVTNVEAADPWTVAQDLFGDLAGIHLLHGVGEAAAHLQWLASRGYLEQTDQTYMPIAELPTESLLRMDENERRTNCRDPSRTD